MNGVSDSIRLGRNMLVATIFNKFAKCAEVTAHLWVPLDAAFWSIMFCVAHFNNMILSALLTDFTISCLDVFAWTGLHFLQNLLWRPGDVLACVCVFSEKIFKEETGCYQYYLVCINLPSFLTSQGNIGAVLFLTKKTVLECRSCFNSAGMSDLLVDTGRSKKLSSQNMVH